MVALLLAGCAAPRAGGPLPAYSPPTSGPDATLLVRVTQAGSRYVVSAFQQPVSCSGRRQITAGTEHEPERVSTRIAADRLQTVAVYFESADHRRACEVMLSFEPARGHTYLMRNQMDGQQCGADIAEVGAGGNGRPVPSLQRQRRGQNLADEACQPLTSTTLPGTARPQGGAASLDDYRDLLPKP